MALWNNCGNGFVKASFAKCSLGNDAYLCCPGPSLAKVNPEDLKVPGATVFALNTAYPYIRPDVWIGMDGPECYDRGLWWESFMKICRGGYQQLKCEGIPIKMGCNVHFADMQEFPISEIFHRRSHDAKFCWYKDTLVTALHIMVWMGAKRIYLVGMDLGGDKDYHDERVLSDQQRDYNHRLYTKQKERLLEFTNAANINNVKVISCTEDSPINEFLPYTPLNEALEESKQHVPVDTSDIIHAFMAKCCKWTPQPRQEQGVIVGCANVHEDLIPWWLENYKKHNDYPIAFADFGLSKKGRDFCSEHGVVIPMTDINVDGWFRKPFAILRAPFKKIAWFDVDVEIKGNIQPVFALARDEHIAIGIDSYKLSQFRSHLRDDQHLWDTGVISTDHGNKAIRKWAEKIAAVSRGMYLGDHEVLADVTYDNNYQVNILPKHIHRMRMDGSTGDSLLYHWTGPTGKAHIRKQIKCRV